MSNLQTLPQFRHHPRDWRNNLYVYPVISRRSGGLSIGINLNPDTACNFDCVYCQVDRTIVPRVREVNPVILGNELREMIGLAQSGELFADASFSSVPASMQSIRDFAFSGDGEPTTCKCFRECVEALAQIKRESGLREAKIVLITDACYLTKPDVVAGLVVMDQNDGEIWAKLDAGTEEYYSQVNRPNFPLQHVVANITSVARVRPIVIQSLFMRLNGIGPDDREIDAYIARLKEISAAGGQISLVQIYTVARRPAQAFVGALSNEEVDHITDRVRSATGLIARPFYGASTI